MIGILLLNASFEPIYVISPQRAASLLLGGQALPVQDEPIAARGAPLCLHPPRNPHRPAADPVCQRPPPKGTLEQGGGDAPRWLALHLLWRRAR